MHLVHTHDVATLMVSLIGNEAAAGQIYNVAGAEFTSIAGCIHLMARVMGVEPNIVHVPLDVTKQLRTPLVHWGEAIVGGAAFSIDKALQDLDWRPHFGLEAAYRDSYEWYRGRAVATATTTTSRPTTSCSPASAADPATHLVVGRSSAHDGPMRTDIEFAFVDADGARCTECGSWLAGPAS